MAAACGVAALVAGYVGAAKVFRPDVQAAAQESEEGAAGEGGGAGATGEGGATAASAGAHDAGGTASEPAVVPAVNVQPAAPPPRVRVRVVRSVLQSCGDGEELTTPGERCEPVAGLEEALRAHLPQLGNCPSAEQAAERTPDATLSIGLRVDFARHRVTALPGRSSSVRDPLTYVPCARAAMEHADELWSLTAPHPRYLMFFMVRFAPGGGGSEAGATPGAAGTPTAGTPGAGTPGAGTPSVGTPGATPAPTPPEQSPAGSGTTGATPGANAATANSANGAGTSPANTNTAPANPANANAPNAGAATPGAGTPTAGTPGAGAPTGAPEINAVPLRHPETVQVAWDRALIREWPQTGAVRARLPRGTELTAVARSGSWYQVRYEGGEGWVFGEAIGR